MMDSDDAVRVDSADLVERALRNRQPSTPVPSFPAAVVDAAREAVERVDRGDRLQPEELPAIVEKLIDIARAILATVPGDKGDANE